MINDVSAADPLDDLAAEFLERYRRGERPAVSEFAQRCPERADEIRDLFPALVVMEELKPAAAEGRPVPGLDAGAMEAEALGRLGDYRIVREIGRGGMGIVYEAVQESLGRQVALKVLPRQMLDDPDRQARFDREARAAARLHHTNIVPVFGVGQQQGLHFYAMQYIHGLGLDKVLQELRRHRQLQKAPTDINSAATARHSTLAVDGPPDELRPGSAAPTQSGTLRPDDSATQPPTGAPLGPGLLDVNDTARARLSDTLRLDDLAGLKGSTQATGVRTGTYWLSVARVGVHVAGGLAHAHEQGVLHRDIKPSNLLLDTRGTVWIADFGLAKADDQRDLTHTGDLLGTLRYMAPEMFGGRADAQSDIYSLGLTLYELLALRPAFEATDRGQLIRMVLHESPPRLTTLDPAIPRDLETIVHKAIDREPAERYASAHDLADDLERFLRDEPIAARRLSQFALALRWCRRNRLTASLVGTVALLVLLTAAVSLGLAAQMAASLRQETALRIKYQQQLFETSVAQAAATRLSGRPGQRVDSLAAVQTGASLLEPLGLGNAERRQLRNEVIGALALVDLKKLQSWGGLSMNSHLDISDDFEWFARATTDGKAVQLRRVGSPTLDSGQSMAAELCPNNHAIHFSAGAKHLWAFDLARQTLRLFDCETRTEISLQAEQSIPGNVTIATHPTQQQAIVGDTEGRLQSWDLETGELTKLTAGKSPVTAVSYSADGRLVAVRLSENLEIRDAQTGKLERTLPGMGGSGVIAWRSDGDYLALAQGHDVHIIEVRDPGYGEWFICTGHQSQVTGLEFHPQKNLLVSSSWDGTTRIWDAARGVELLRLVGQIVRFDKSGRLLATRPGTTVEMWEVQTPVGLHWLDRQYVSSVAAHPRLAFFASSSGDGVRLWDGDSHGDLAHLPIGHVEQVTFRNNGQMLTAGVAGVWNWPVEVKEGRVHLGPPKRIGPDAGAMHGVHSSQDEQTLFVEHSNLLEATLILQSKEPTTHKLSRPGLRHTALCPTGRWAAAGNYSEKITIWETKSGRIHRELPCRGIGRLSFSPNGKWLVSNSGQAIQFWDVATWELKHEILLQTSGASGIGFTPDSHLVAIGHWGSGLRLYDVETAELVANFDLPENPPVYTDLEFSAGGDQLIAGADNMGLCIWDLRTIRRRLVELGLDWDQKPIAAAAAEPARPLTLEVDLGELKPAPTAQP